MQEVIVDIFKPFTCDGVKYRIDPKGLCGSLIGMPVHRGIAEYKACDANLVIRGGELIAKVADEDFDRIGQPSKFTCAIIPVSTRRVGDVKVITTGKISELYYDDDCRVVHDEKQKTSETPQAKSPQDSIIEVCDSIKELLLEKNRKYGNSALNPCRVFSKADSVEQLKVRIDDKINRIKNEQTDEDEDVVKDLIGYLVLLVIARGNAQNDEP